MRACGGPHEIDTSRANRFDVCPMNRLIVLLCVVAALAGCAAPEGPATRMDKADVLPLALDDSYQFRKILTSVFDPELVQQEEPTRNEPINFERLRRTWGAVDSLEVSKRFGNYFTIFWRTSKESDVTLRLEYRQAGLGNYVMAQERFYPAAKGSRRSTFQVVGDDFLENGRVSAWRVLLVVDGRIVAFRQSYMWR
jgi:hypothetical protein